jgi:hypothetical protein
MRRKLFVLVLFFSLIQPLTAQVANSSKAMRSKKFSRAKQTVRVNIPSLLDSASYYLESDKNKAFEFLEQAYIHSLDKQYYHYRKTILVALGDYYEYYEQHDLAALNYQNALRSNEKDPQAYRLVLKAGEQYKLAFYPRQSLEVYNRYFYLFQRDTLMVYLWEAKGDVYTSMLKNDSALIFYRKAEDLATKQSMTSKEIQLKLKIAGVLPPEEEEQKLEKLNMANTMSDNMGYKATNIQAEKQLADFYKVKKQERMEIERRNTIISKIKENESALEAENFDVEKELLDEQINLARIYLTQGKYDSTINILNKESTGDYDGKSEAILELKKEAAKLRSEAYQKTGNEQEALKSYEEYSLILSELYQKSEMKYQDLSTLNNQLRDHQWRIDFLEKDKEIYDAEMDAIEQDNRLREERLAFQFRSILMLSIAVALLIITLILLLGKYRLQRRHNDYLALKSLRTQMNPHFIFNALNSINNFIVKNDERNANKYLSRFSRLMRSILNNSEQDLIPLSKEIEILELYLQMEHMRFPNKFEYTLHIDPQIDREAFQIPPMLIQPYIENAVWHGLRYLEEGGKLLVSMAMEGKNLKILIEDNGIGRSKSQELKTKNQKANESKGIKNTTGRLKILSGMYKQEIKHEINDVLPDGSGTRVEILLPQLQK